MKDKDNNLLEEDVLSSDYVDDTQEIPFLLETPEEKAARRRRERIRKREEQQKRMNKMYTFMTIGIGIGLLLVLAFLIKTTFFGKEKTPIKSDLYQIHTSDGLTLNYDGDNEEAMVTSFTLDGIKKYVKEKHSELSDKEQRALSNKLHKEVKAIVTPGKNLSNGDKVYVEFDYSKYFSEDEKDRDYEFIFEDKEITVSGLEENKIIDAFEGVEFYYKRFTGIGVKSGEKDLKDAEIKYQVVEYNEEEDKIIVEATIVPKNNNSKTKLTFKNGKDVIQKLVSYETLPEGREDLLIPNSIKGVNDDNETDESVEIENNLEDKKIENNNTENNNTENNNTENNNQPNNTIDDDFSIELGDDNDSHSLPSIDENGNEIQTDNQDNSNVINIDNGNL